MKTTKAVFAVAVLALVVVAACTTASTDVDIPNSTTDDDGADAQADSGSDAESDAGPFELHRTIFSGTYRTCALREDGVYCWGMIGDFTYEEIASQTEKPPQTQGHIAGGNAIRFPQLDDAVEIAMTESDTCVRTAANQVRCYASELFKGGDPVPRAMGAFTSIVGAPSHVCGLAAEGTVSCWGEGAAITEATVLAGLTDAVEVASGGLRVCARHKDHSVGCWSETSEGGVSATDSGALKGWAPVPIDLTAITGATRIAVGYAHACAVVSGTLRCWGTNSYGELGTGATDLDDRPPTASLFKGTPRDIALATVESCALDSAGLASCWGRKYDNTSLAAVAVTTPEQVRLNEAYAEISVGEFAFCARRVSDKAVRCWRPGSEPEAVVFHVPGTPFVSPPCNRCGDLLNGKRKPSLATCTEADGGVSSKTLLDSVFDCVCNTSCATECGDTCVAGASTSPVCQACAGSKCSSEYNACMADVTP